MSGNIILDTDSLRNGMCLILKKTSNDYSFGERVIITEVSNDKILAWNLNSFEHVTYQVTQDDKLRIGNFCSIRGMAHSGALIFLNNRKNHLHDEGKPTENFQTIVDFIRSFEHQEQSASH